MLILLKRKNNKQNNISDSENSVEKKESFIEFDQYYIFLYSRNGSYICNNEIKNIFGGNKQNNINIDIFNEKKEKSNNPKDKNKFNDLISNLIKAICASDFKKDKKNEGIYYNTFILNNIKIISINIPVTNLIAIGIFSKLTKSGIIRLYLLHLIISYINYQGDKKEYFNSKNFKNINSIDKMNLSNFHNYIYSKIFETFLSIPLQIHFKKSIQKVFKKQTLYIKDIYYKNYYLIDLNTKKLILNGKSLHNNINNHIGDCEPNIRKQKKIWKELIFHCKCLKKDYIKKNDMNFNENDFKNFFAKIEFKCTYPNRTFIIIFLPLLNGICIIHEYIELNLYESDEFEVKKKYTERKIIYGYESCENIFRKTSKNFFENEHNILKQIHFFIIESLFNSNISIKNIFYLKKEEKIYFSEEILDIIKEEIFKFFKNNKKIHSYLTSSNHSIHSKKILKRILDILYEEYIQINGKEKILHRSSSVLPLDTTNHLSFSSLKSINSRENTSSLQLTKYDALLYIFSTIKLNKNIDPDDITLDLNDENDKDKNKCQNFSPKLSELSEINIGHNKKFNDLLPENELNLRVTKIKNGININAPYPRDSCENEIKSNGGYYEPNKDNGKKKDKNSSIYNFSSKNKESNKKNKINIYGEQSFKNFLIDDILPNINDIQRKKKKSNKKFA